MKLFFQKDVMIDRINKLIQLMIRIKNFVLESPPGYLEYHKAILSKDENFNYLENEHFKRHVLPHMIKDNATLKHVDYSSINHPRLFNDNSAELFKVNPVTGLPMIGVYDAGGNPYGFNYNHFSIFNQMNSYSSINSFD